MAEVIFSAAAHQAIVELSLLERWKRGLMAMGEVAKDPDRTDKVLEAYEHLNAGGEARRARYFYSWHEGERLFAENRTLDATTVDFDALSRLPEGTLGHAYARFMKERGLTPDIFAAKGELSRETYVIKRLRQTHDLWHVLTGIDTDVPGELELQAFTLTQMLVPSAFVLVSMGTLRWIFRHPTLPFRVLRGAVNGLKAKLLAPIDWESRWSTPLTELRAELLG
jgi:ubiquinone biosynthesis protein COQ4